MSSCGLVFGWIVAMLEGRERYVNRIFRGLRWGQSLIRFARKRRPYRLLAAQRETSWRDPRSVWPNKIYILMLDIRPLSGIIPPRRATSSAPAQQRGFPPHLRCSFSSEYPPRTTRALSAPRPPFHQQAPTSGPQSASLVSGFRSQVSAWCPERFRKVSGLCPESIRFFGIFLLATLHKLLSQSNLHRRAISATTFQSPRTRLFS